MSESGYFLLTFGCQKNNYDSELISAIIEGMGYYAVESPAEADLVILNTCCVRNNADEKVYGRLGQFKQLKRENSDMLLIVTGCLAQKDRDVMLKRFSHVDIVLGPRNLDRLGDAIMKVRRDGERYLCCDLKTIDFEVIPVKRESAISAWIPVSEGCDCYCTYCIVPMVRGAMVSRPLEKIVQEIEDFIRAGGKEVTLLGQNVNSYGSDLCQKVDFADVLRAINSIEGLRRIRYTSPYPGHFTLDFINRIKNLERLCEHVHLPLQAGDDRVLKRMGRHYSVQQFSEAVANLRAHIPGIAITTDFIVGFPGETDEEYENTLKLISEMQFDGAFMFAYSEREGTAAARMKGAIPHEVRLDRLRRLIEQQNIITRRKNEQNLGKVEKVLVESISKKKDTHLKGRTRKNKLVHFEGKVGLIGEVKPIKLIKAYTWGFMGELQ